MVELLLVVLAPVLTFLVGLVSDKPGYTKGKNVLATVTKALEDDKLTRAELEELRALVGQ